MIRRSWEASAGMNNARIDRDMLWVHGGWALVVSGLFMLPGVGPIGVRFLLAVLVYNTLVPLVAYRRRHRCVLHIWLLVFPLSLFQVVPDWFLAEVLGVLVFPETGVFRVGAVSAFMAGLWAVPLFVIVYVSLRVQERGRRWAGDVTAAVVALIIFGMAEATLWRLDAWVAQDVTTIGHVALYVLPPEMLLGWSTFRAYLVVRRRPLYHKVAGAGLVMLLYLGSLCASYLLIERGLLS